MASLWSSTAVIEARVCRVLPKGDQVVVLWWSVAGGVCEKKDEEEHLHCPCPMMILSRVQMPRHQIRAFNAPRFILKCHHVTANPD